MQNNKLLNRFLTVILSVFLVILVITFSIGLPIYFRPFYYMQIENLGIPEKTGHTVSEIKDAYNEVLDFLVLPNREFGTGVFKWSESGKSHFEDCKRLFDLNLTIFIISLVAVQNERNSSIPEMFPAVFSSSYSLHYLNKYLRAWYIKITQQKHNRNK